ncbi:hypothetical protein [Nitrobacter sp. JJSN]|uniref:hypothetical protein n=1 Tax=Nitrobacter sp. JJSN TaxID=3453033 RepID=UPI003F765AB5
MTEVLENDLVWGVSAIAREINQTSRQTHYMLERGLLPGGQQGQRWVASRKALREHFEKLTSGAKLST